MQTVYHFSLFFIGCFKNYLYLCIAISGCKDNNYFSYNAMKCIFFSIIMLFMGLTANSSAQNTGVRTGADRMDVWLPMLENKRVGLVVNQTSLVSIDGEWYQPLADTLLSRGVNVRCIMSPEHGYLGTAGAGKAIPNSKDRRTGLTVLSLYGKTHKPLPQWLHQVDVVVFDLQDVGTRFYTYLSTLYYMLQACGEEQTDILVLDRPNPNDTIDGPMLRPEYKSFVGIVPVPLLHGCTLGELARMMVGEKWIGDSIPNLTVIPCEGWNHGDRYSLPVAPSPNLPTMHAIHLYPSLCLFEGTDISIGRGTDHPFECYGHPMIEGLFEFTPRSCEAARHPLQENRLCHGVDLRGVPAPKGFSLDYLMDINRRFGINFITSRKFFDRLAGSDELRRQIIGGMSAERIRNSWQRDLTEYRKIRRKYVIYDEPQNP